jgi:hypothetical protein
MANSSASPSGPVSVAALRAQIGWLCHLIRAAAAAYTIWQLAILAWYWSDSAAIVRGFGRFLKVDLSGISTAQYALAVAGNLVGWALQAAICYCIWCQFGTYLQGRIFTADAALWMRRVGIAGLVALLFGMVWRHLIILVMTFHLHLPLRTLGATPWAGPFAVLQALFWFAVIGLAWIYEAAARMANENAQFV